MADPRLSPYDHLLVNALIALVSCRIYDPDREDMWLRILHDALPKTKQGHPMVAPLRAAAVRLLRNPSGIERAMAYVNASAALVVWAEWRIGVVQERLKAGVAA